MRLPMVDCRNLIKFCQAFDQHKSMNHKKNSSNSNDDVIINPKYHPFCSQSPFAVVDILMLILVIGVLGFLIVPYINTIYHESAQFFPIVIEIIADAVSDAPIVYVVGLIAAFSGVIASIIVWEILEVKSRKCGRLKCKGLHKAVEFDIRLESEQCVKYASIKRGGEHVKSLEAGEDYKELEAELKRMAPVNGRTVLIFRARCGCVAGRLEVWGPKRVRRVKK